MYILNNVDYERQQQTCSLYLFNYQFCRFQVNNLKKVYIASSESRSYYRDLLNCQENFENITTQKIFAIAFTISSVSKMHIFFLLNLNIVLYVLL